MTLKVLVDRVNQLDDKELPNYLVDLFEIMEKKQKILKARLSFQDMKMKKKNARKNWPLRKLRKNLLK